MNATNDIRYVCLSDLHLGEEDSLLTGVDAESGKCDPLDGPVPVLDGLADRLEELIDGQKQRPTLILLGDALELALATDNVAAMAFERFIRRTFAEQRLFEGIVYVPGNHDHHVWESARETQYVQNYLAGVRHEADGSDVPRAPLGTPLEPPWHTTRMLIYEDAARQVDVYLPGALVHRFPGLEDMTVLGVYPHLGLRTPDGAKVVLFHHGHLLEELYRLMSTLRFLMFGDEGLDQSLDGIEALNFAWIDFFWSTMGRSGEMGTGIELLYEVLSQRPEQLRDYADAIAHGAARKWNIPYIPTDWLEEQALRAPIRLLVGLIEHGLKGHRRVAGDACDDALVAALRAHLTGPVARALTHECVCSPARDHPPRPPDQLTFVFGHTHKPFATVLESVRLDLRCAAEDLGDPGKQRPGSSAGAEIELPVTVYNLGGWVIDTEDPEPLHGAAALLLNEALDAVWLPLYREGRTSDEAADERRRLAADESAFAQRIADRLTGHAAAWSEWDQEVSHARQERADRLGERVDAARAAASAARSQTGPAD